jgi:hypothetical protein
MFHSFDAPSPGQLVDLLLGHLQEFVTHVAPSVNYLTTSGKTFFNAPANSGFTT